VLGVASAQRKSGADMRLHEEQTAVNSGLLDDLSIRLTEVHFTFNLGEGRVEIALNLRLTKAKRSSAPQILDGKSASRAQTDEFRAPGYTQAIQDDACLGMISANLRIANAQKPIQLGMGEADASGKGAVM